MVVEIPFGSQVLVCRHWSLVTHYYYFLSTSTKLLWARRISVENGSR